MTPRDNPASARRQRMAATDGPQSRMEQRFSVKVGVADYQAKNEAEIKARTERGDGGG